MGEAEGEPSILGEPAAPARLADTYLPDAASQMSEFGIGSAAADRTCPQGRGLGLVSIFRHCVSFSLRDARPGVSAGIGLDLKCGTRGGVVAPGSPTN